VLSAEGPATEYAPGPVIANVPPRAATDNKGKIFFLLDAGSGGSKALYIM